MIPRHSMIQTEFQLEIWTFIIQKSMVIPPSSLVLFLLIMDILDFEQHIERVLPWYFSLLLYGCQPIRITPWAFQSVLCFHMLHCIFFAKVGYILVVYKNDVQHCWPIRISPSAFLIAAPVEELPNNCTKPSLQQAFCRIQIRIQFCIKNTPDMVSRSPLQ